MLISKRLPDHSRRQQGAGGTQDGSKLFLFCAPPAPSVSCVVLLRATQHNSLLVAMNPVCECERAKILPALSGWSPPLHHTTPHHTIPFHSTTPHHTTTTTSHHITLHHTTPHHTIPNHTIPFHYTTSHHTIPHHTTPHDTI